jgi:hypothetical protein
LTADVSVTSNLLLFKLIKLVSISTLDNGEFLG